MVREAEIRKHVELFGISELQAYRSIVAAREFRRRGGLQSRNWLK